MFADAGWTILGPKVPQPEIFPLGPSRLRACCREQSDLVSATGALAEPVVPGQVHAEPTGGRRRALG